MGVYCSYVFIFSNLITWNLDFDQWYFQKTPTCKMSKESQKFIAIDIILCKDIFKS